MPGTATPPGGIRARGAPAAPSCGGLGSLNVRGSTVSSACRAPLETCARTIGVGVVMPPTTVTDGWSQCTPLALSYAGSGATTGDGSCGYSGAWDAGGALAYAAGGGALTRVAVGAAPGGGGVGTTLGGTTTMRSNREAF